MEDAGFEAFVRARGRDLWRAAWLLTGDAHMAEDLVQSALAKAFPHYRGNDVVFESYVRTTMYRTFCSWWRRSWRGEVPSIEPPDAQIPDSPPSASSIDLARALDELPRKQRAVLVMRYFEDQSIKAVADALGMPEGTVKAYSHKALRQLSESRFLTEEDL